LTPPTRAFLVDLAERSAATYVEAFAGLLVAGQATNKISVSVLGAAAVAALPAGLAVLKAAAVAVVRPPVTAGPSPLPQAPAPVVASAPSLDECLAVLGQLAAFEAARAALPGASSSSPTAT